LVSPIQLIIALSKNRNKTQFDVLATDTDSQVHHRQPQSATVMLAGVPLCPYYSVSGFGIIPSGSNTFVSDQGAVNCASIQDRS
jgi:hypothetical protein